MRAVPNTLPVSQRARCSSTVSPRASNASSWRIYRPPFRARSRSLSSVHPRSFPSPFAPVIPRPRTFKRSFRALFRALSRALYALFSRSLSRSFVLLFFLFLRARRRTCPFKRPFSRSFSHALFRALIARSFSPSFSRSFCALVAPFFSRSFARSFPLNPRSFPPLHRWIRAGNPLPNYLCC